MSLAAPWALLALLALPAVVALHLFRRRYRTRNVAGLFLFAADALVASAGRHRTPLVRSWSLWLELAAAALLALWLAGPRLAALAAPPHLVFVLDDSASMSAIGGDGVSFAARARTVMASELERAGGDARVTLVVSGARPRVLVGPAAPAPALAAALAAWHPQGARHDFSPALTLASELGGEVAWLVTDGEESVPAGFGLHAVGEPLGNAAIVHARRGKRDGGERLWLDATAFAATTLRSLLSVHAVGAPAPLAQRSVELAPDQVCRFEIDLPPATGAIEIALGGDALAVDDRCLLLAEPPRTVGVGVRMASGDASTLQLAHALRALGDAVRTDAAAADLEITSTAEPAWSPGPWSVQLVIQPGAEPIDAWVGPFLLERRHPLLHGVTLEGVIWSAGGGVSVGRGLVFAGDQPLLGEDTHGERLRLTLALHGARSNLASSPDWPILLSNIVELARERLPGPGTVNVQLGDPITWRRRPDDDVRGELRLLDPAGQATIGIGAGTVAFDTHRTGLHRLLRAGQEVAQFAVNFADARESDLRRCAATVRAAPVHGAGRAAPAATKEGQGDQERRALAVTLLLVVLVDWWFLRRGSRNPEAAVVARESAIIAVP